MIDLAKKEHSFGAFALGVAVGVGAVLLFGTEEGKKISKTLFDKLPENIKNLTDSSSNSLSMRSESESTSHHATYSPPPAPHIVPRLPKLD